jgi:hypothetical protein
MPDTLDHCSTCARGSHTPPEPPVGTWVRAAKPLPRASRPFVNYRQETGWGVPGTYPAGQWAAMCEHWGELEVCGPWGTDLPLAHPEVTAMTTPNGHAHDPAACRHDGHHGTCTCHCYWCLSGFQGGHHHEEHPHA